MKKIFSILTIGLLLFTTTGCFKRDNFEDITIYTTAYPTYYITNYLYGEHSTIKSIYPNGVNINSYKLTKQQIKEYSNDAQLLIFNGLSNEKNYVVPMLENNKNLKIIDTSLSMEYEHDINELWLDPSNFLMLTQNIRDGLREYINNHYLKNEINEKYDELKIKVSEIDAKLKLMAESSNNKTLVVSSDLFKFLEKYNLNIISLEENDNLTDKVIEDVKDMINRGEISYIFVPDNDSINDTIKDIQAKTDVQIIKINSISNLTEEQHKVNKNYLTLMNENINLFKNELYD